MGPLDAVLHLINFFLPAAAVGALAAGGAKVLWRRDLARVRWWRLAVWTALSGAVSLVLGLLVFEQDGRMATYALLVLASACALWWMGFGPGRGRAR